MKKSGDVRRLRNLLAKLLNGIPRKILWQELRIRTYDLYMLLGDYSDDVLQPMILKRNEDSL